MTRRIETQKPRYVLIIEDNVHHAELMTELLDRHFAPVIIHTVDTFADGMDFLAQSTYDLILSTAFIGSDAIADRIKDFVALAGGAPLIITAGRGDEALAARLTRKGASEYLVKTPETLDRLADVIKKQLRKAKRRAEAHPLAPAARAPLPGSSDLRREMEKFREEVKDAFNASNRTSLTSDTSPRRNRRNEVLSHHFLTVNPLFGPLTGLHTIL
jgi:DNA-binding NtrC family response regulator